MFGCAVVQGYGLTETAAAVSTMTPADTALALCTRPDLLGSVGPGVARHEIRVVDTAGRRADGGCDGRGRRARPAADDRLRRAARRDAGRGAAGLAAHRRRRPPRPEGYLHLTDRLTDVIVSGGENVYSAAVEQVLCAHPAVAEAAVVGVPDARWGETVHAAVVLRPGAAATADDLVAFCRDRLGGVARPRSVEFLSALPRTSVGKVHKRALRAPFWAGRDGRWRGYDG